MALIVKSKNRDDLIKKFHFLVENEYIQTWIVDKDGDYTPSSEKWRYHAWMRVYLENDGLAFGFVKSVKYPITNGLYAVIHGRLAATLLAHASELIQELIITPQLDDKYDRY